MTTSILPAGGSDHCAVTLVCQRQAVKVDRAARRSRWAVKKADWDLYRVHLNEILSSAEQSRIFGCLAIQCT
eukprot:5779018-Amphidinium_carterae.4